MPEGQLEISGPEAFVDKQIDRFVPIVEAMLIRPTKPNGSKQSDADTGRQAGDGGASGSNTLTLSAFENLFALADDKIQILKDLPGSGKAQKTVNAALLTAYGNSLRGIDEISFDTIRDMCESHGCLDSSNFAKTISTEKEWFIVGGSERKKTAKLTVPGKRKVEQMARDLNAV